MERYKADYINITMLKSSLVIENKQLELDS